MTEEPEHVATFDKSCPHCPAFMPEALLMHRGEGRALFGVCMARLHDDPLCPAARLWGIPVEIHLARRGKQPTRAIVAIGRDN